MDQNDISDNQKVNPKGTSTGKTQFIRPTNQCSIM